MCVTLNKNVHKSTYWSSLSRFVAHISGANIPIKDEAPTGMHISHYYVLNNSNNNNISKLQLMIDDVYKEPCLIDLGGGRISGFIEIVLVNRKLTWYFLMESNCSLVGATIWAMGTAPSATPTNCC